MKLWEILKKDVKEAFYRIGKNGIKCYLFKEMDNGKIAMMTCFIFNKRVIDSEKLDLRVIAELYEAGALNEDELFQVVDDAMKKGKIKQSKINEDLHNAYIKKCGKIYLVYDSKGEIVGVLKNWE